MTKKSNSFSKNLFTIIIGSAATKLVSFLLVPLYTAILSTDEFGSVDIAITTISLLIPIFTGVIFEATLRFALDDKIENQQVFSTTILIDVIGIVAFLLLSPLVLLYKPLKSLYMYFVLYFIAVVLNDSLSYFARGLNEIKKYTISGVFQTIILCILNVLFLVVLKMGISGYFLSYILSSISASCFLWCSIKMNQYIISLKRIQKTVAIGMLRYSVPLIPNTISWWVSSSSDRYFIIAMCGVSANGIYSVASKLSTIISLGTSIFNTAWQITAVEDYGSQKSKQRYAIMCFNYYSIMLILGSCIIQFCRIIAKVLFQQEFYNAWIYVPVLVVAACFHAFSTFIGSVFMTTKKTKYMSYTTLVGAGINIIMNYILIKAYGLMGAAIATLISYIIVYVLRFYFAQKIYSFPVKIYNDIACFLLILAQIITVCMNNNLAFLISFCLLVIIIYLRRKSLVTLYNIGKSKLFSIVGKE